MTKVFSTISIEKKFSMMTKQNEEEKNRQQSHKMCYAPYQLKYFSIFRNGMAMMMATNSVDALKLSSEWKKRVCRKLCIYKWVFFSANFSSIHYIFFFSFLKCFSLCTGLLFVCCSFTHINRDG